MLEYFILQTNPCSVQLQQTTSLVLVQGVSEREAAIIKYLLEIHYIDIYISEGGFLCG